MLHQHMCHRKRIIVETAVYKIVDAESVTVTVLKRRAKPIIQKHLVAL